MPVGDKEPFVKFGGDPKPALDAIRKVSDGFKRFEKAGKTAAKGISMAFKGLANVMKSLTRFIGGAFTRAWRLAKVGIVGVVGAITAATVAWNKEAAAQARINTILRNNIKNWRGARKELDAMIRSTQRLTNFGDRDVETVFMNLMGQLGQRGFGAGRQLLRPILDVSAALGIPVQTAAEAVARNIGAGTVGETFRRFGVRTPVEQFRGMSIEQRIGSTAREIGAFAGGAAQREAAKNPFVGMVGALKDALEPLGRPFAGPINDAAKKLKEGALNFAETFSPKNMSDIWLFIRAQATATFAFLRTYISGLFGSGGTNDPTVRFAAHAGPGGAGGGGTTIDPLTAWYNRNIRRHFRGPGTQPSTIQKGIKGINQFGQNLQNLPSQFMPGGSSADALSAAQTAYTSTLAAFPGYSGLFGEGGGDQGGGAAPQGVMQFAGMSRAQQIAIAQRNARGRTGRVRADVRQQNYQAYLQSMAAAQNAALMNKAQGGFLTSENFTLLEGRYPLAFESDEFRRALRRHFPRGPGLAAIDSFGLHNRRGAAVMAVQ